jgi:hypothetical protein
MTTGVGSDVLGGRAVVTGIGQSQVGRRLGRSGLDLTVEACLRAIADAGLTPDDIDGVATYPGGGYPPGFSGASCNELHDALGLRTRWHLGTGETAGQLGPVMDACVAVAAGRANHVVCFRSVWESTAQMGSDRASMFAGAVRADRGREWTSPYGAPSAAVWIAMYAQRYMHDFGLTREQLAQIALTCRANAALNPAAVYRTPLTMDDYLSARMISPAAMPQTACPVGRSRSRRSALRSCSVIHGTSARTSPRWPLTTARRRCGNRQTSSQATLTSWSCTTASATLRCNGLRRSGSVRMAKPGGSSRVAIASRSTVSCRSIPRVGNSRRGVCMGSASCLQIWREGGDRQVKKDVRIAVAGAGGGPVGGCMLVSMRD